MSVDPSRSTRASPSSDETFQGQQTVRDGPRKTSQRTWIVGGIAVVAAMCIVAGGYAVARGIDHGGGTSDTRVLIAAPSYAWLPNGQFNEVAFITSSNATVTGVLSDTNGLVLYIMTPNEFLSLTKTGTPGAYVWTSGPVPSPTDYSLSVRVSPGSWDLVFFNPSTVISSGVNFWTSVTETTS